MRSRRSIRAFLGRPVPTETIKTILELATRAPSGSNMQPWNVYVLMGEAKIRLSAELLAAHRAGDPGGEVYDYYPRIWSQPYLDRRRATGWALYRSLGIERGDKELMNEQLGRNYLFFDAPVGLIFTVDGSLAPGSLVDYGRIPAIDYARRSGIWA